MDLIARAVMYMIVFWVTYISITVIVIEKFVRAFVIEDYILKP